ncbi:MAG TPA: CotH kinase family protein, partial [Candidatus Polarisedimenticolaceae bacterium]|nr:CotH kinase family protein [Candidatus Polarisedimenticolaceae bacterium]
MTTSTRRDLVRRHRDVFVALLALAIWAPGASADVVIHEIMYHPLSNADSDEFVEIFNTGGSPVDISNWCFDGVDFCFPAGGTTIGAGDFLVIANDAVGFQTTYGFPPDHVFTPATASVLDDAGERLALIDQGFVIVDELLFTDEPPWPVTPDGLGPSLEVIDATLDNSTPRNWRASLAAGGTPGAANSVAATGLPPWIDQIQHTQDVLPLDPVVVTARVVAATTVDLTYKIDFGGEVTLQMLDNGSSGDGGAGDGVYGAAIPGQPIGTLVRYRITATGPTGTIRYPRADDTVTYDGTAVVDPALSSELPILHWFIDPIDYQEALDHRLTDETEPAVLFYDGTLYDAVETRIRGASARQWPKPPWKFFTPQGHNFAAPGLIVNDVDTFNIQSGYADKSYTREVLAWETVGEAGLPAGRVFPIRVEQNGQFFGLFTFLEAPDSDFVVRNRLDVRGARYKAFENLRMHMTIDEIVPLYEKKSRLEEDHSDLWQLITQVNQPATQQIHDWLADNIDIPTVVNYIAAMSIVHNNDHLNKNYFLYRDT